MFNIENLKKRILEISYKHKLSHIGSCLTALPIICEIYEQKREEDIFILSSGHAGLALYVVLETIYGYDAEKLFIKFGVHPSRDLDHNIFCSTGSLGIGVTIGVGAALASPHKNIYILCSDGESFEGSFWESLRFAAQLNNCRIFINLNGFSAYNIVDVNKLTHMLYSFSSDINIRYTNVEQYPFLKGMAAHYYVMAESDL